MQQQAAICFVTGNKKNKITFILPQAHLLGFIAVQQQSQAKFNLPVLFRFKTDDGYFLLSALRQRRKKKKNTFWPLQHFLLD